MEAELFVTGIGLTTSLGRGVEPCWTALAAGASGIRPLVSIDVSTCSVKDGGELPESEFPGKQGDARSRAAAHLLAACREALARSGAGERAPDPERTALLVGSSLAAQASAPAFWEGFCARGPAEADYAALRSYDTEPLLDALCESLDVRGEALLVSNACAAGASSLALAADAIRRGRADVAIAAGFDALDVHTFAGFASLKALAPGQTTPFSAGRTGMKLGDGFAAVVLERAETARRAGRRPIARLLGYGESADAHHLTQPEPEGRGAALAMRRALEMAGLDAAAIDYVNTHGTATPANDVSEARAMRSVFGERLARIPLSATKPAIGHTLGGAGAVEAVVTLLVLERQLLPPTLGIGAVDPEIGSLDLIPARREARVRHAMSNSFGFGGCNASLIFGEPIRAA
ncbi:beta-ketoacyl-[acyl-carrier-protein] synthase family protein [bacterium]|nr:beta-ketoacyl-[acyl-carrier-protein] synthase family protein [bacterium]